MSDCMVCGRIKKIIEGSNPYFIAELETGYVVSGDHQFFKGYTLFLCKQHVAELHQLETDYKLKYLEEMSLVSEAVFNVFNPVTLNYEALGNSVPHLHWHIFPRHADDPNSGGPIWEIDKTIRYANEFAMSDSERLEQKRSVLEELSGFSALNISSKFE